MVRAELQDFATKSSEYVALNTGEWKQAAAEIRDIGVGLIKRQRFYATRLRDLSAKMDQAQAISLLSCAESMDNDAQSMLTRMQDLLGGVETRLAAAEVVDQETGLMNRRELERRIELRRAEGKPIVRLLFQIASDGPTQLWDQVVRQVASRLTAQLRPDDLVGRWSESEFMVLFNGTEDIAERRGPQVAGLVTGRYSLANGAAVGVRASATVVDRQLIGAPAL